MSTNSNTDEARAEILRRIRGALRDVPAGETPEMVRVERDYLMTDHAPHAAQIEEFIERVSEYKATVQRVASEQDLPGAIERAIAARGVRTLVVPADFPDGWTPGGV